MGVCIPKSAENSVNQTAHLCIRIAQKPYDAVVNTRRTKVPRLQSLSNNPLMARRAQFLNQHSSNEISSGLTEASVAEMCRIEGLCGN